MGGEEGAAVRDERVAEGLALSLKPPQIQFGESIHGKMDFQNTMREIETAHKKRERLTSDVEKLVLVLVGLPARGKSMYGHKLSQFLSWRGYKVKNFGVGAWRRGDRNPGKAKLDFGDASPTTKRRGLKGLASFAEDAPAPEDPKKEEQRGQFSSGVLLRQLQVVCRRDARAGTHMHALTPRLLSFFSRIRPERLSLSHASSPFYMIAQASQDAFKELLSWMTTENGQIGIFDASNVTIARRAKLTELANQHSRRHEGCNISLVFIECIVTDEDVIHTLMRWKVRHSADFKGLSEPKAMEDLADRIRNYEKSYQTVREAEGAYIKIFDLKAKVHACNIFGRMAKSVLPYVLAIHQLNRPVFLLVVREKGGGGAEGGSAHDADLLLR